MSNKRIERISDDQLYIQTNAVKAHIRRTRKHGADTRDAEVELCYLEREKEIRDIRKALHENYKKSFYENQEKMKAEFRVEEEAMKELSYNKAFANV